MKSPLIAVFLIGAILVLSGCGKSIQEPVDRPEESLDQNRLSIAVTFYPLEEATRMVTGDSADVFSVIPAFSEPHGYAPSPREILDFNKADVFVTMGLEFENLEEDLISSAENVIVINAAEGIELIEGQERDPDEEEARGEDEEHDDEEGENDDDGDGHAGKDPHVWLSPENVRQMVENVKKRLVEIDPENAALYEQKANESIEELAKLDEEFRTGLASCGKDVILVSHNAFSYLARDYGFEIVSLSGLSPEAEPTPQQIKGLIDSAREHELKYVFYEAFVDPRVSTAIASEVGAEVLELNPIEGASDQDATYFSMMRKNLENLKIAMECT